MGAGFTIIRQKGMVITMYAYKSAAAPSPTSPYNNNAHRVEHRFQILLHRVEMDSNMLQAVFYLSFDGTAVEFTGLLKKDPAATVGVLAQKFHNWNFGRGFTIKEFKDEMEKWVSGLSIVNK